MAPVKKQRRLDIHSLSGINSPSGLNELSQC